MYAILFVTVLLILGTTASFYNYQLVASQDQFKTYTNKDYGFSIDYPSTGWEPREVDLNPNEVVVIEGPQDVHVTIAASPVAYANMTFTDAKAKIDEGLGNDTDIRVASNTTTIDGKQAIQVVYYGNTLFTKLKNMEIVLWKGTDGYSLNFESDPGYFTTYLPQGMKILKSFRLL